MNTLKLYSPAKINLTLEILNKRQDNFHNIISLVTDISLKDEIVFSNSKSVTFDSNFSLDQKSNSILNTISLIKKNLNWIMELM